MNAFKTSVSALALAALTAGGIGAATLFPSDVMAEATQSAPAAGPAADKHSHHHNRFDAAARARFLEGRIAYYKTVLGITPAQENAWGAVADALRANAKDRMALFQQARAGMDKPKSAIDRLQMRIEFTKMAQANQERLLNAAKPLYDSFSPQQKRTADQLMARAGGHRHHGWHGDRG